MSEEEKARIARLSAAELADMLRRGDALHKFAALTQLEANGGREKNFDLLLSIAAENRGPGGMIVKRLVRPVKEAASDEDKRRIDRFVDFLEAQLKSDEPSVPHAQAVRSLGQAVHNPQSLPDPLDPEGIGRERPPYGYARVMGILISCLDNTDWLVREEAIYRLGKLGAQDPAMSKKAIAALEAQLAKEDASEERTAVEEGHKRVIDDALRDLMRRLGAPGSLYEEMMEH